MDAWSHSPTWLRFAPNVPASDFKEVDAVRLPEAFSLLNGKRMLLHFPITETLKCFPCLSHR